MSLLKKPLSLLVMVGLMVLLASLAYASTESLSIPASEELTRTLNLATEDRIIITFTAVGGGTEPIHFYMIYPNGTTLDKGTITQFKINFISDTNGVCELHFNNTSPSPQIITLNYEVEHYYYGLPSLIWLLIGVAVLLLFVVAGYMAMGKYGA